MSSSKGEIWKVSQTVDIDFILDPKEGNHNQDMPQLKYYDDDKSRN